MAPGDPERITNASVYPYDGEIVVELTGVDRDGVIVVVSYQFERAPGCSTVEARGQVDPDHADRVREALTDEGYDWTGSSSA